MRWRCAAGIFHRNAGELRLCCIWPSVPPETDGHSESQLVARKQFPQLPAAQLPQTFRFKQLWSWYEEPLRFFNLGNFGSRVEADEGRNE